MDAFAKNVIEADRVTYAVAISIYVLLAVSYALQRSEAELALVGAIAIIVSVILMQKDFVSALSLTILVTHIGPILKGTLPGVGMVNLGDIYLGLIVVASLLRHFSAPVYLGPFRSVVFAILAFMVIGVPFLPDVMAAVPGYLSLLQLTAFYFVVLNEIRTDQDIERMLDGIGWAVIVSASLQLACYAQGISLGLSQEGLSQEIEEYTATAILGGTDEFFVKTTFFYVSFYGSCTAAMVIAVSRILWRKRDNGFLDVGFWSAVFVLAATTSLVAGSRTSLLAAAITMSAAVFMFVRRHHSLRKAAGLVFPAVVGVAGLIALALVMLPNLISENQFAFYSDAMLGDQELAMSVGERFIMWSEIPEKIQEFPTAFLFGVGPDVPQRAQDHKVIQNLMQIRGMESFQPFSFHNFYIDTLVNLGLGAFVLLVFIGISTIVRLGRTGVGRPELVQCCLFAIIAWLLLWTTHATGWSKPVLIMSELFALSHLLIARRIGEHN